MVQPLNKEILSGQLGDVFREAQVGSQRVPKVGDCEWQSFNIETGAVEDVWAGDPPEAVIFASNSVRKVFLLIWQFLTNFNLHEGVSDLFARFNIPFNPEELPNAFSVNTYFSKYVHNGDGKLRAPVYLFDLPGGVPLILCPTDGESSSNVDPVDEARKKIADILGLFVGKDVLIFAADSVQDLETAVDSDGNRIKLGKPANGRLLRDIREQARFLPLGEEDILEAHSSFYLRQYYRFGDERPVLDVHETGVVMYRWGIELSELLQLQVLVEDWHLVDVIVDLEAGGGGIFQQIIRVIAEVGSAQGDMSIWQQLDPSGRLNKILEQTDPQYWQFIIFFHIMGQPGWIFPTLFATLNKGNKAVHESEK